MNQPITSRNLPSATTSVRIKVLTGQRISLRSRSTSRTQILDGSTETIGILQTINGIERVFFPEYDATPTVTVLKQWWDNGLIDMYRRLSTGAEEEYFHD